MGEATTTVHSGDRFRIDEYGDVRVMAVAEGYAMCRRPRAIPFAMRCTELLKRASDYTAGSR